MQKNLFLDITADWSDSDGDESTQSEIQLTIVEKELEKCKQERNEFKVKCKVCTIQ